MTVEECALQPLIDELDTVIAAALAAHLDETAALLRIARLDLMRRAHCTATYELEQVSIALRTDKPSAPRRPRKKKRPLN